MEPVVNTIEPVGIAVAPGWSQTVLSAGCTYFSVSFV